VGDPEYQATYSSPVCRVQNVKCICTPIKAFHKTEIQISSTRCVNNNPAFVKAAKSMVKFLLEEILQTPQLKVVFIYCKKIMLICLIKILLTSEAVLKGQTV